jgi:glycosyltransferase involved in cell wall biosynthesis
MNSAPSISVVMPVYHEDVAEHFDLALESLSSQTLRANEILVVKDGPLTDALDDVLQRWIERDSSMKVVELKTNQGLSAALNAGIDAANYDWIARMDADDICRAQRFDKQCARISPLGGMAIFGGMIISFVFFSAHLANPTLNSVLVALFILFITGVKG